MQWLSIIKQFYKSFYLFSNFPQKIEGALEQYKVEVKLMTVEHKKKSLEVERDLEKERVLRRQLAQKCIEQGEAFEVQQKLVGSLQQQVRK